MNAEAVINNISDKITDIINNTTDDVPLHKILQFKDTHRRIVELAFALGEDRLLRHINRIGFTEFIFDNEVGYFMKENLSIRTSDFYKEIFKELVGKDMYSLSLMTLDDVEVKINLQHEELSGEYRFRYYIPMIEFKIPGKSLKITHGEIMI